MSEIDAIKSRHSVRTYQPKRIEQEKIDQLNTMISECNEKGKLHIQFIEDAGKAFNRLLNKAMGLGTAPSVIACVGHADDTLEERIGYYGERIVLYAQELGLNTCWTGTFNAKNVTAEVLEGEKLVIVIAIGYGVNQGKQHKSKSFDQVVTGGSEKPYWFRYGVELALLAPTAINQQKFVFDLNEDGSVSVTDKGGPFSKVDLGIVKYHFDVGAEYVKKTEKTGN